MSRVRFNRGYPVWTEADRKRLIELWPRHSTAEIAQLLGKTQYSIRDRARLEGLRKRPNGTAYRVPRNKPDPSGTRRITISFDEETFASVLTYAKKENCSFSRAAIELIEFGLEDIK